MSDRPTRKYSTRVEPSDHSNKVARRISTNSLVESGGRRISQHFKQGRSSKGKIWNSTEGLESGKTRNAMPVSTDQNGDMVGELKLSMSETTDAEIHELFQLMDVNKDQKLAPKELDCVLRALGINATEADLIEFIGELPTVEEGQDKDCVTYEQFAESIKKNMALTNETDSLQVTFNAFDHAGDGFIDGDKLKSVLSNLGLQFHEGDIQAIIHQIGSESRISFDEFQRFMLNNDEVI